MATTEVTTFSEIEEEFAGRAHRMVWCNVATVDARNRPRSRILHPIWEGPIGWIATRRHSYKAGHLERNPFVSAAYIADVARPVYVDCRAEWVDDLGEKVRIWEMYKAAAPPLGYDPAPIFVSPDDAGFGLLKLVPYRITLYGFPEPTLVWRDRSVG